MRILLCMELLNTEALGVLQLVEATEIHTTLTTIIIIQLTCAACLR